MRNVLPRIGIWLALSIVLAAFAVTAAPVPAAAHPTIDIAVANWKFTPAKITVTVGEPTTLRFTSTSGLHGVASDDLSIPSTNLPPGKDILVTFTPKKAGTYVVHCAVFCGPGHADMKLTIEVADK